jgi:hypothetical protein
MILPCVDARRVGLPEAATCRDAPWRRPHEVDAVAEKNDQRVLISLKWQQTGGTAEQKVQFEVMCLTEAVTAGRGTRAILVLGDDGWSLRDYFTSGKMSEHPSTPPWSGSVTLEAFVRLANNGQL